MEIENIIFDDVHFSVVTIKHPHIDRHDGGHIVIMSKDKKLQDLIDLSPNVAAELIRLTQIVGKAMKYVLNNNGVDIGIINYQINGNWSVNLNNRNPLHLHLYGRAKTSINQKYGEALYFPRPSTGFYDGFVGLNSRDVEDLRKYIIENI